MKKYLLILICLLLSLCFTGCERQAPYTRSGFALDTFITITVYDTDKAHAQAVLDEAFDKCLYYDRLFNISDPSGDIYRLNHANGAKTAVSEETYELLQLAVSYAGISGGLLDVTIQPVYALWDFTNTETPSLPEPSSIEDALKSVDYHNIRFEGNGEISLTDQAGVNPGAIAKGYIADRLKELLISKNITSAMINLGGNVQTIGTKPGDRPFVIGLQKPFDENGAILTEVSVSDRSVVTSGIYQRCFTIDGKIYHHILDPNTGYPADNGLNAAVIIADSSVEADALSTICMLMSKEDAMAFLKTRENVQAIFIDHANHFTAWP
ncbi:MAG: FAD:protein FMN transferase [Lachnospiraceae bacterium]|nr:FAD:protein FMN transferase [Lachnospiraceae bacterium]